MRAFWVAIAVYVAVCWTVGYAYAHTAPTGWAYDTYCCSKEDCRQIDADKVESGLGGTYRIKANGQVFFPPDQGKRGDHTDEYRWSQDQFFHACEYPAGHTRCLYIPMPSA